MVYVIGLEGSISGLVNWGTPVVEDDDGIFNPVTGLRVSPEQFRKLVSAGHASQFDLYTRYGSVPGDAIEVDFVPEVHCVIQCGILTKLLASESGIMSGVWQHFSFRNMNQFEDFASEAASKFQHALASQFLDEDAILKEAIEILLAGRS
jgi:hypothetical protein